LVGVALANAGFKNIVAGDLSPKMLEECVKKGVYQDAFQMTMGEPLKDFTDGQFDAIVCVGVFQPGGPPPSSLHELIRICKHGGYIFFTRVVFVLQRNIQTGYEEEVLWPKEQEDLEKANKWNLLNVSEELLYTPGQDPDTTYKVWTYHVL